jgi:hypothetical protein
MSMFIHLLYVLFYTLYIPILIIYLLLFIYRDSEVPEALARDVIKTYKLVMTAIEKLKKH